MGEAAELVAFCERLRPRLVGTLSLVLGDATEAEDVTQETLGRVWDRWARVRTMDRPDGWAYRVAVNIGRSRARQRAARRRREQRVARESVPATGGADRADALVVRDAVAALPLRQRTALVLRYFADLSVAETAQIMGCAQGTVKSLTHQAIAALRDEGSLTFERTTDGA